MIKIYISPSCSSCRKVKKWFTEQNLPFKEINIMSDRLTYDEIKEMLIKSIDGTDEIISTRSKIMKNGNIDLDSMSLNEVIQFIIENPSVLKRPIIVDDRKIQVGYNEDEIRVFIPVSKRLEMWKDQETLLDEISRNHIPTRRRRTRKHIDNGKFSDEATFDETTEIASDTNSDKEYSNN